jgi:hypothetical protein
MVNYDPAFLLGMGLTHSTEVRGSELPTSGIRQIAPIRGRQKETALAETRQSTVSAHAIGLSARKVRGLSLYNSDEDIRGLYQTHSSLKDISGHTGSRFGFLGLFASKQLIYRRVKQWISSHGQILLIDHASPIMAVVKLSGAVPPR